MATTSRASEERAEAHSLDRFSVPAATAYLFATDESAPRRRRPVDVLVLVGSTLTLAALWWAADLGSVPLDERLTLTLSSGILRSSAWVVYSLSGLYAVGLITATILRAGATRGILRDLVVTSVAVAVMALVVSRSVGGLWPDVLPEAFDHVDAPSFPGFRLALVAAIVSVERPHLAYSVRRVGRRVVIACFVTTLLLGFTTFSGALTAVLLATVVVAAVRLAFGSPDGLPPIGRLRAALARLGVDAADVAYGDDQRGGVGRATAVVDGRHVAVKVYGRDATDTMRAEQIWRALWYRRSGASPGASRIRQVEHEALGLVVAGRYGVDAGELVAGGEEEGGDALLVVQPPDGRPIGTLEEIDDDDLAAAWDALRRLHDRRFAHGNIGPESVVVGDASVGLAEFQDFSLTATEQQAGSDVASLLVTTAGLAGVDRAAAVAVDGWPAERIEASLPYLQLRALPVAARAWADERDVDLDELRAAVVDRLEAEPPELVELRRITWGGVVMVAFAIIAANAIISQIAEIGAETLLDELRDASVGWLVAAFVLKISGYFAGWLSMQAVLADRVPILPTVLLQSAKSFVGLVVPSTVGRVAMDVRFLQKLGTPTPVAVAQGPLISVIGFVVEVLLLLLTVGSVAISADDADISAPASGGLILAAIVLVAVAVAVVLAVPKLRDLVVPPVRDAVNSVRAVITSPRRMVRVFVGELLDRLGNAFALGAVVIAFGQSLSLAELVFVTVGVGLLAGLAPVPGGVAVAEALLTGLLTAVGLEPDLAFAIAITYRLVTAYLPPVFGFFALRYLTTQKYL